jgi:hypothetical protein
VVFLSAALLAALVVAALEWVRILESVYQWCLEQLGQSCDTSPPSRPPGEGAHDGPQHHEPDRPPFSRATFLSSPSPASSSADLGSAAVFAPGVAAIDPSPSFEAFGAGLELMVFTALFTICGLLVLNWILKTMRGGG